MHCNDTDNNTKRSAVVFLDTASRGATRHSLTISHRDDHLSADQ